MPEVDFELPVGEQHLLWRLHFGELPPRRFEIEKLKFDADFGSTDSGVSITSTSTSSPEFVSEPLVSELFEAEDPPQESSVFLICFPTLAPNSMAFEVVNSSFLCPKLTVL